MTEQTSITQTVEGLAREFGLSPAAFAREVTRFRVDEAIARLEALGSPSFEEIQRTASGIGLPVRALRALLGESTPGGALSFSLDAFTEDELEAAHLAPPAIVENYLYRDLSIFTGQGGISKTTIKLHEVIHIVLGLPAYGLRTRKVKVIFVTGEDSRERIAARLHAIMNGMDLNSDERAAVLDSFRVIDVVGQPFRLCELDRAGNVRTSDDVSRLIDVIGPFEPGLVIFDPLASFGAPEQNVNDAAQGAVNASRKIIRDLECGVVIVHHTGQEAARENIRDQYTPRGGSALSDGARMVHVISRPKESDQLPFSVGPDDEVFVLTRAKGSYCGPQPGIYLKRTRFRFEHFVDLQRTDEEKRSEHANQIETFLIDQLKAEQYHSKNTLEALIRDLKLSRNELRAALNELVISDRLTEKELPDGRKQGGRKTFLCPSRIETNLAGFDNECGEVDAEKGCNAEPTSPGSTTSPPYRKKNGGEVEAACSFPPFPQARSARSAKYGEVGEIGASRGAVARDRTCPHCAGEGCSWCGGYGRILGDEPEEGLP